MEDMARKRTILIHDRGLENALEDEGKNRVGKRTILIDGPLLENTLDKEDKDGKSTILIGGWKTHTKRKKNRVGKHTILTYD